VEDINGFSQKKPQNDFITMVMAEKCTLNTQTSYMHLVETYSFNNNGEHTKKNLTPVVVSISCEMLFEGKLHRKDRFDLL